MAKKYEQFFEYTLPKYIPEKPSKKLKEEFVVFVEPYNETEQIENSEPEILIQIDNETVKNRHIRTLQPALTKKLEVELVEKCLELKAADVRNFLVQGKKWLYEKYFPVAFYNHNKNNDWDKCHITKHKVRYSLKSQIFSLYFIKMQLI